MSTSNGDPWREVARRIDKIESALVRGAKRGQGHALESMAADWRATTPINTGALVSTIHVEGDSVKSGSHESPQASLIEFGTSRIKPQPFIRPAVAAALPSIGSTIAASAAAEVRAEATRMGGR